MYVLFVFILINNLVGLIPYSFAPTSHFILTFSLSFTIVLGATILGLSTHGLKSFSFFVPSSCPLGLLPLLALIEFISYLARNVSLGLRLAANILSGHMLLNVLSGFTYNELRTNIFFPGFISIGFYNSLFWFITRNCIRTSTIFRGIILFLYKGRTKIVKFFMFFYNCHLFILQNKEKHINK